MSVTVQLPEDLYQKAAELAAQQHRSADDVIVSALEEQLEWERLRARAARGSREDFLAVLDKVPDVEPDPEDRI